MDYQQIRTLYRMVRHALPMARLKPDTRHSIADLIEKNAVRRAAHPYIRYENRSVSYAEHNAEANRVAHWGLSIGLQQGDVVALLMQNRPEYLAAWAGLAKIGVTSALINSNLVGAQLAHAIDAAGTARLIVGSECLEGWHSLGDAAPPGLETYVWSDSAEGAASVPVPTGALDLDAALGAQPENNPGLSYRSQIKAGDPHVYIYTSGTTGLPKAAKMSHLRFGATGLGGVIAGFDPDDTMYCALPLYHSAGGAMAVGAVLRVGGTLALRRRFSASQFWEDINRYDATAFQYIGEFCRYLLHQEPSPGERTHRLKFCIGNGLRPDIWAEFQERFAIPKVVEFYGATEGNVALLNFDGKQGSVGRKPPALIPAPVLVRYDVETDDHVRDAEGLCIECAPGEVGELVGEIPTDPNTVQGRFEGYTSKEATDKKILRDVRKKGDTWFRTGDLLRCDDKGYFYFVDRIGDTFRWKGENVSTQEVAEAIGTYPGIALCNVYGVELGNDGRAGMAALVFDEGHTLDGAAMFQLASESLPSYAQPVFLRLQAAPEMTGTFKLRKVDLQREGYDPGVVSDPLYVRDDEAKAYVELTPERFADLQAGRLRV